MPHIYRTTITGSTTPAVSTPWMPSRWTTPFELGISADFTSTASSGVVSVQFTFDPVFDQSIPGQTTVAASAATWYTITALSSVAVDTATVFNTPCVALRATHTSTAAASVATVTIVQSGT